MVTTFPRPGSKTASPWTEISFRGHGPEAIGTVKAVGSQSGWRTGRILPHADGQGGSFVPDVPFQPGEQVTVTTSLPIRDGHSGVFTFTVARPAPPPLRTADRTTTSPHGMQTFRSRPDLIVPTMTIAAGADIGALAPGLIFLGPSTDTSQNGALIVDTTGQAVWFLPQRIGPVEVTDVRVQTYQGKPVLTWWEGISAGGHGLGHAVIYDQAYQPVASVHAGNGYAGNDLHEFVVTAQDTALVTVFNRIQWDQTAIGGPANATVLDGIAQEIEIATGRVLFEWHSLDHVGLDETYVAYSSHVDPTDYFHINSIEVAPNGNLIVSARNTWTVYQVDRTTGDIVWRLGGKHSDFTMGPNTQAAYQHDAHLLTNGDLTLFDNGGSPMVHQQSRGLILHPDLTAKTVTLVKEYDHPTPLQAGAEGNVQVLPNGNIFIGWGTVPYYSEYRVDGTVLYDVRFSARSYRAYRLPWTGQPKDAPAVAVEPDANDSMTVYASWNGATEVASWEVLGGATAGQLQSLGTVPRRGFETPLSVTPATAYVAVRAKDRTGKGLGTSKPVAVSR